MNKIPKVEPTIESSDMCRSGMVDLQEAEMPPYKCQQTQFDDFHNLNRIKHKIVSLSCKTT